MVPLHGLLFYFILGLQLTISEVMARFCGGSLENECVLRPNCKIGTENGKPIIDFQELQGGNRGCATTETCCPKSEVRKISSMNNWYPFQRNCGNVNSMGLTFTIRGFDDLAQEAELPWMVALLDATRLQYKAAGSLIAPDVVLTATHVTQKVNEGQLIVRAGEWDFNTKTEQQKHVDVAIRKIVRHPDFSISTGANNVALLFLEGPLELSRHINIICLPPPNRNFIRDRCFVSGWGKKHIEDNNYMNILKKIEVPIVDRYTCERQLHELLRYSSDFRLDDTLMCAGGEIGKDSCDGDGGAPLFCPIRGDPQRFEQAGIVAFGIGCGEAIPAVYTDVSKMSGWITQQIEANLIGKQPQPNYGWKNTKSAEDPESTEFPGVPKDCQKDNEDANEDIKPLTNRVSQEFATGTSSALSAQQNGRKRTLFQGSSTSTGFETPTKRARLSVLKVNMVSPFSMNRNKEIKSVVVDGDSRSEVSYEIPPNVDQQVVLPELHEGLVEPENQIQEDSFPIQIEARECRETSTNTDISIPPNGNTLRKGCSIM
ncbi:hypothetical protein M5D96_003980 [Drosophila gunungcola]|uniref:Phenoloxidase-activating factor 2 n=1 Tax=Drosophila gunungcola TaxID=103775 RepID=A0A9P9YT63_9MUSC|nr:hypothetical protein M5D96_003980 [Drosophila gunungcola]